MYAAPRFLPAGDRALVVEFGEGIDEATCRLVRRLHLGVRQAGLPGVEETVPSYRSLLVYYDPLAVGARELTDGLRSLLARLPAMELPAPRLTVLPVCYEADCGPDLDDVAAIHGLSRDEAIALHTRTDYLIYMLGFTPGFPYLGNLSARLATPRLSTPRRSVPAGSVGIAGNQTGVYPVESPGGWRIIGRTPVRLFDPAGRPPVLLAAGDYVRFVPVGGKEYAAIQRGVEQGAWAVHTEAGGDAG